MGWGKCAKKTYPRKEVQDLFKFIKTMNKQAAWRWCLCWISFWNLLSHGSRVPSFCHLFQATKRTGQFLKQLEKKEAGWDGVHVFHVLNTIVHYYDLLRYTTVSTSDFIQPFDHFWSLQGKETKRETLLKQVKDVDELMNEESFLGVWQLGFVLLYVMLLKRKNHKLSLFDAIRRLYHKASDQWFFRASSEHGFHSSNLSPFTKIYKDHLGSHLLPRWLAHWFQKLQHHPSTGILNPLACHFLVGAAECPEVCRTSRTFWKEIHDWLKVGRAGRWNQCKQVEYTWIH